MSKRAVLLANLGSPDNPDVPSVRRYLKQFLMDPYVIQLPWMLRWMIVNLFVLPFRPTNSAEAYSSVWTDKGSPLIVLSREMLARVREKTGTPVAMGMRYGNPSIESAMLELAQTDLSEVLFVPLYPQYAESTVATSTAEAREVIEKHGLDVSLKVFQPFYNRAEYIDALVSSASPYLENNASYDHVLFSYHGLPELHLTKADPTSSHCLKKENCCSTPSPAHATCYRHQVFETTRLFVEKTGLREDQYTLTFQSRLGRAKWLAPYTEETLKKLAGRGVRNILVMCPAFITDCLETLEEIEMQGGDVFREAGGESLTLIPCLNSHPEWIQTLVKWIDDPAEGSAA